MRPNYELHIYPYPMNLGKLYQNLVRLLCKPKYLRLSNVKIPGSGSNFDPTDLDPTGSGSDQTCSEKNWIWTLQHCCKIHSFNEFCNCPREQFFRGKIAGEKNVTKLAIN
jgi:hypothetical protein